MPPPPPPTGNILARPLSSHGSYEVYMYMYMRLLRGIFPFCFAKNTLRLYMTFAGQIYIVHEGVTLTLYYILYYILLTARSITSMADSGLQIHPRTLCNCIIPSLWIKLYDNVIPPKMYVHDRIRTVIAPWEITTRMGLRVRISLLGLRVGVWSCGNCPRRAVIELPCYVSRDLWKLQELSHGKIGIII